MAFDLDDTLFDRRSALCRLLESWLGADQAGSAAEEIIAADGNGHRPRSVFFAWLAGRFPSLIANGPELAARFRRELPACIEPDSDVLDSLGQLEADGIPIALLSNGSAAFQQEKLRACGAIPFFQKSHRLFSSALGFEKPDPRAFHALIEVLEAEPPEILFVGDDPLRDIEGARGAGLRSCRLRRPDREVMERDADLVIDSFQELAGILRTKCA